MDSTTESSIDETLALTSTCALTRSPENAHTIRLTLALKSTLDPNSKDSTSSTSTNRYTHSHSHTARTASSVSGQTASKRSPDEYRNSTISIDRRRDSSEIDPTQDRPTGSRLSSNLLSIQEATLDPNSENLTTRSRAKKKAPEHSADLTRGCLLRRFATAPHPLLFSLPERRLSEAYKSERNLPTLY